MPIGAYIGISAAVIVLILFVVSIILAKKKIAICPNCGHVWKPKYAKILFGFHDIEGNSLVCPVCNTISIIKLLNINKLSPDQKCKIIPSSTDDSIISIENDIKTTKKD